MTKKPKALPTALGTEIEALAMSIAAELKTGREAVDQTTGEIKYILPPLDERISGFKALTVYYGMIQKIPLPDDEGKGGFSGYKDTIRGLGQGKPRSDNTGRPNGIGGIGGEF